MHDGKKGFPRCVRKFKSFFTLPDSTTTCVIIQHPQAMLPRNVTCWLRYFADDTFQLDCAASLVEFIGRCQATFVNNFNFRHCIMNVCEGTRENGILNRCVPYGGGHI